MDKIIFPLYLFPLIFAPLAFGTIDPWAQTVLEAVIFFTLFLLCCKHTYSKRPYIHVPGFLPLLLFLGWVFFQLIPLPISLVHFISPATAALYTPLQTAPNVAPEFIPLSVHPWYTFQDALRFSAYIAYYFLTIQLLTTGQRMQQTLKLVFAVAFTIALYGIIQHYTGSDQIFWLRTFSHKPVGATFSYKNHYAAYLALLLPIVLSLYLYNRPRSHATAHTIRQQSLNLIQFLLHRASFLYGLTALLFCIALLLSGSRGGVFCAGIGVFLFFAIGRGKFKAQGGALALLLIVTTISLSGIGRDGISSVDQRFGQALEKDGSTLNGRLRFWKNAYPLMADFPITGTGSGTFRAIYPRYQTESPSSSLPLHAHNDYIETFTDTGLIGVLCLALFFFSFFRQTKSQYRTRRDRLVQHLYLGSLAGIIALLCHSGIDLQFRLSSAIGLYFILLLGIHAAALTLKQHKGSRVTPQLFQLSSLNNGAISGSLCLFAIVAIGIQTGELKARAMFPETTALEARTGKAGYASRTSLDKIEAFTAYLSDTRQSQQLLCTQLTKATLFSPGNPRYWYARSACETNLGMRQVALQHAHQALLLNPTQALYSQHYATLLENNEMTAAAQAMFLSSVENDPTNPHDILPTLGFLVRHQQTDQALQLAQRVLAKQPNISDRLFKVFADAAIAPELLITILPQRVQPYLSMAQWYQQRENSQMAEAYYSMALTYLEKEEKIHANFFWQPLRFFKQQKNTEKALFTLQQAILYKPLSFAFNKQLAATYYQMGLFTKALERYRYTHQLKPDDQGTQNQIDHINSLLLSTRY